MRKLRAEAKKKLGSEFLNGLDEVADSLNLPTEWILFVMDKESGMNPRAVNLNTNGTRDWGLIQFNDLTIQQYGITGEHFINLSAKDQLPYIQKYYSSIANQINSVGKLYLWNLSPSLFLNPNEEANRYIKEKNSTYEQETGKSPTNGLTSYFHIFKNKFFLLLIALAIFIVIFNPFNPHGTSKPNGSR